MAENKRLALLLDEESVVMKYYVQALETRGFRVLHVLDPDAAFDEIAKHGEAISVAIVDIMVPPGRRYSERESEDGLKTGVLFWQDLRVRFPNLPIVVLTNVARSETLNSFSGDSNLRVLRKLDYPPEEAADVIDAMTNTTREC